MPTFNVGDRVRLTGRHLYDGGEPVMHQVPSGTTGVVTATIDGDGDLTVQWDDNVPGSHWVQATQVSHLDPAQALKSLRREAEEMGVSQATLDSLDADIAEAPVDERTERAALRLYLGADYTPESVWPEFASEGSKRHMRATATAIITGEGL